jgi:YidC/Oxa1 family membrane protein insertase
MPQRNTILFFAISALIIISWFGLSTLLYRGSKPPQQEQPAVADAGPTAREEPPKEKEKEKEPPAEREAEKPPEPARPAELAKVPEAEQEGAEETITLGDPKADFLTALLDSKGAGVLSVTLRDFQAADKDGKPMWEEPGHKKKRLELVQEEANQDFGSFLLYDADAKKDDRPYARLGKKHWHLDKSKTERDDAGTVRKAVFYTQIDGVRITKTYILKPGDYHLGLDIGMENTSGKDLSFRYHLTGPHGLPIEGEWYTTPYNLRNAVIVTVDDQGRAYRSLQMLRTIGFKGGGEEVPGSKDNKAIQCGGVTVQYFSSLAVVREDDLQKKFLLRARPTIETAVLRGKVWSHSPDRRSLEVVTADNVKFPVLMPEDVQINPADPRLPGDQAGPATPPQDGDEVSIVYRTDEHDHMVARQVWTGVHADRLLFDDITVHLVSDAIDLKAGAEPVTHHYLLYNGPVKVALLSYMDADQRPEQKLVDHYLDDLHLRTVTDYQSPGWVGDLSGSIGWTWVLIHTTNIMHYLLWVLHSLLSWIPGSKGLSILLLTVLVRGLMFPLSRRQALTSVKMQALAPEIKKLQEKYKDDKQALGMAQMELYRKHGVNPVGSCWTIFLQMPIFLGLYYALQESIRFRLAPFLWISSLSAPDMLIYWTRSIPVISSPSNYGAGGLLGFFYLGPYFNLLPVIVAGFMLVQQKMMTPPPTDEQQETQQKMMKFMTVFFALMFYKLAAGLCLYFITSSLWGFTERKLLPKRKIDPSAPPPPSRKPGLLQKAFDRVYDLARQRTDTPGVITAPAADKSAVQTAPPPAPQSLVGSGKRKKNKRKDRNRRRDEAAGGNGPAAGSASVQADGGPRGVGGWLADTRRNVHAWWQRVLRDAKKK